MSELHTDALVAKTEEIPALAGHTFVTIAPHGAAKPYMVWHPAQGTNTQESVTGPRVTRRPRYTGHLVAEDARQVQRLLDLLEAKLFPSGRGAVLEVEGERSFPLWFESPLPIQVQTDPQPTIVYALVECGWRSDPV